MADYWSTLHRRSRGILDRKEQIYKVSDVSSSRNSGKPEDVLGRRNGIGALGLGGRARHPVEEE